MRLSAPIFAAGLLAASAPFAAADTPVCGQPYTVARGDTLQKIAAEVYGPEASYYPLYKVNRAVIGRDSSLIEVGMVLRIPCPDPEADGAEAPSALPSAPEPTPTEPDAREEPPMGGPAPAPMPGAALDDAPLDGAASAGSDAPEGAEAPAPESAAAPAPPAPARPLLILAATGWAPFLDSALPGGGMIAEILSAALSREIGEDGFRIDFINDRAAHLRPLLADHAYDLSIAWLRPDCGRAATLAAAEAARCAQLAWSAPLFEQVVGYYTRAAEAAPATHAALRGRRFCRPAGFSTFMMDEAGLTPPAIALKTPATAEACFAMLLDNEVDVVVVATPVADQALSRLSAHDEVAEQPQLAAAATLHAVSAADNPRADAALARIDEGLRRIREDGTWLEIVRRGLTAHARRSARR
ncbi:LysM peptidoglycan-binding domain-containing protein [Pikeienuella sp. HZG-20]|uniref:LysM peptidoglycan-binding domain-containing protein n=1 Tax=Paludibacillus litoralis TaxID=3133267 RepID=UPI0030EB2FEA